ncbi:MAG: metallophosphoesterase [Deltaproteobacteria bacterium]|nr:metallophosphoesterase [Deltaproteobacteria bacterium]
MNDWVRYLKTKCKTPFWGAIALDYFNKCKGRTPADSPSAFIDWLINVIYPECVDVVLFHREFLNLAVRLLGSDFLRIMRKSSILIREAKKELNPSDIESIISHYAVFGREQQFRDVLQECGSILGPQPIDHEQVKIEVLPDKPKKVPASMSAAKEPIRICHISDLHFGGQHNPLRFWGVDEPFNRTDYFINFLRTERREGRKIDLLLISGDVTSTAAQEEYEDFERFLGQVEKEEILPPDSFYDRVVLVPGNHEVRRGENSTRGDCLKSFKEFIAELAARGKKIRSPYSAKGESKFGMCVLSSHSKEDIPFALHAFPELGVEILTLVSCFYSQGLDHEVVELIDKYETLKAELAGGKTIDLKYDPSIELYFRDRIYLDTGFFSPDYVGTIPDQINTYLSAVKGSEKCDMSIALAHHHGSKYFEMDKVQETRHHKSLLSDLSRLNFIAYLHGHIHFAPDPTSGGLKEVGAACLGAIPTEGTNGFNMLNIIQSASGRKLELIPYYQKQLGYRQAATLELFAG